MKRYDQNFKVEVEFSKTWKITDEVYSCMKILLDTHYLLWAFIDTSKTTMPPLTLTVKFSF